MALILVVLALVLCVLVGAAAAYPLVAMGLVWVWFPLLFFLTKKDRIWPALREASTPQMLRALYAAISLRFGKFLISDPGVSLFGILPRRRKREAVQNKPPLGFKQEVNSNGDEGPLGRTSRVSLLQT